MSPLPSRQEVLLDADRTFSELGVWPLSFSYPQAITGFPKIPRKFICPSFPGHRYRFTNVEHYLENYSSYQLAMSHRKGGWDCFRHLEIIFAGAIPYLPDAHLIPRNTMVHYPKRFLEEVAEWMRSGRAYFDRGTRLELATYFNENLTTAAMARYLLLKAKSTSSPQRVLFVDEALPSTPDYSSLMTLIGLKQVLGRSVLTAFPVDYLFESWQGDENSLYGRGFGYTRTIPACHLSAEEIDGLRHPLQGGFLENFDTIVVGSISRNFDLAMKMFERCHRKNFLWIHGEDNPPEAALRELAGQLAVPFFAREL